MDVAILKHQFLVNFQISINACYLFLCYSANGIQYFLSQEKQLYVYFPAALARVEARCKLSICGHQ